MKPRPLNPAPILGSVRSDELMPAREFSRRLGIGTKAWRALLARGLPTIRAGKQAFLDGAAVLAFFRQIAEQQASSGNGDQAGGNGQGGSGDA